jgi:hypothetical protein
MVDLWANFATHHNPTPKIDGVYIGQSLNNLDRPWESVRQSNAAGDFVRLQNGKISHEKDENAAVRMEYWQKIEKELYKGL